MARGAQKFEVVQAARLPMEGMRFGLPSGDLSVWTPGQGILLFQLKGTGHADFATPLLERFDAVLAAHGAVQVFADAGRLERYDSALRTRITDHFTPHLKQITRLDVLVKSRLVAMGVSVASLALGGIVKSHSEDRSFRKALEAELRARKALGFSADVLDP